MTTISPIYALIYFFLFIGGLYVLFRPVKGLFWLLRSSSKEKERIIMEDILKELYHSEGNQIKTDISRLTGALKLSDSILVGALKKMEANDLISTQSAIISLKKEGREYALKIIRVHRLYEKYLSEKTGFDKLEWHDRAEEMEHLMDLDEVEQLSDELGNPRYDPHGDPIPTVKGEIVALGGNLLSVVNENEIGRIIHIEDEPEVIYKQILAQNIHIGSQIRVIENSSKRVRFYAEGEEFVLAPILASNITIGVINNTEEIDENTFRLTNLKKNETAKIVSISRECRGESRRRLLDLGFVKGSEIKIDFTSPLNDPIAYLIKGTSIALRNEQAAHILVVK